MSEFHLQIIEDGEGTRGIFPIKELLKDSYNKTRNLDFNFLDIAEDVRKSAYIDYHDKIMRVGCVIVKGGEIISSGYNNNGIHAEESAILKYWSKNIDLNNSTLYSTFQPCTVCTEFIIRSKIKKVVYMNNYTYRYRDKNGKKVDLQKLFCQHDITSLVIQPVIDVGNTCYLRTFIPYCCNYHTDVMINNVKNI